MTENVVEKDYLEEDTQHGRFLTFALEEEVFGIEIKYVTEIIGVQSITKVPEVPPHIKGIINLRGKIIPVIDVRLQFGKEPVDYNDRTCIIVIDIDSVSVGLIVDSVDEVITIEDEEISAPPSSKSGFENRFIKGIGKSGGKVQLLLDCASLLKSDEMEIANDLLE
ncbi:chemotaxis protein CheW [Acetobacterium tundrae]|uniref:Chemotaxis protein CheW n=1 Tax=Acetobacterium tundrae TaxID=132932 RepID=A0ABR6WN94_9FIRM|nr:chemotaxis protein CheW [Acetobacterium tundrae]MBC3797949.1 chemotaxis protein CheW [Acetobacterium tundrae]